MVVNKYFLKFGIIALALAFLAAGGFFVWQRSKPTPAQLPEKVSDKTIESPVLEDETADWEKYTNEEFKFELKHPKDLPLKYEAISQPQNGGRSILTMPLGENPFRILIVTNAPSAIPVAKEGSVIESKIISAGGLDATEKVFKDADGKTIPTVGFERNGIFYAIWAEITGNEAERLIIFDQVLSTFKTLE